MMDAEIAAAQIIQNKADISALGEQMKSAHRRIDETGRITEGIHKLAANIEGLALQVKMLTEKTEYNAERIEAGVKS
jgi:hypothetical protein